MGISVRYLTFLGLSFFINKMSLTNIYFESFYEVEIRKCV